MTATAIHAMLQDVFPVREVQPYGPYWRIFLYERSVKDEATIAARCQKAGLVSMGSGWDARRGHWIIVVDR